MRAWLEKLAEVLKNEFSDLLSGEPVITEAKLRFTLVDDSFVEILYPLQDKYSFHWQRKENSIRVNTAPHHRNLQSYPRHLHRNSRIDIDTITDTKNSPEDNLRNFMNFVRRELLKK